MNPILPIRSGARRPARTTLRAAAWRQLGLWDRWIAHGVATAFAEEMNGLVDSAERWAEALGKQARELERQADIYYGEALMRIAEYHYRLAGLHHNLIQWIFPGEDSRKQEAYEACERFARRADGISLDRIESFELRAGGATYRGRSRMPQRPVGCILLLGPLDSSKEELFTYEMDFAREGFASVVFDGPGQGSALLYEGLRADRDSMEAFVDEAVDAVASRWPELKLYLFGIGTGAAWALRGSRHSKVAKTAAISPSGESRRLTLEGALADRPAGSGEDAPLSAVPFWEELEPGGPVLLAHGSQDELVSIREIRRLFDRLPDGKRLLEYPGESNGCYGRIAEIRKRAMRWFAEDPSVRPLGPGRSSNGWRAVQNWIWDV